MMLQEWIDREGGQRKCARRHNFPPATLGSWYRLERFPRPESQRKINQIAGGIIDFRGLMRDYMRQLDKKNSAEKDIPPECNRLPAGHIYRDFFDKNNIAFRQSDWQAGIIFSSWDGIRLSTRQLRQTLSALPRENNGAVDLFTLNDLLLQRGREKPAARGAGLRLL